MKQTTRVGDTIRSITAEAEAEIGRAIAYMNDTVVPEARRSSSAGLRLAAAQLQRMAEQLESASRAGVRHDAADVGAGAAPGAVR